MIGWIIFAVWAVVAVLFVIPCARAFYKWDRRDYGDVNSRQESAVAAGFFGTLMAACWPLLIVVTLIAGKLLGEDQEVHHREQ